MVVDTEQAAPSPSASVAVHGAGARRSKSEHRRRVGAGQSVQLVRDAHPARTYSSPV